MRVLIVTSESCPLGGFGNGANVPAGLARATDSGAIEARLLVPGYPQALEYAQDAREVMRFGDPIGAGETRLLAAPIQGAHIEALILDCPDLFGEDAERLDQKAGPNISNDHLRFAILSHVAAGIALEAGARWRPDLVHAIGWPTGLVPLLISARPGPKPATVFTITDGGNLGLFERDKFEDLALPADMLSQLELGDRLSFLRAGVETADVVTELNPISTPPLAHASKGPCTVFGSEWYADGAGGSQFVLAHELG